MLIVNNNKALLKLASSNSIYKLTPNSGVVLPVADFGATFSSSFIEEETTVTANVNYQSTQPTPVWGFTIDGTLPFTAGNEGGGNGSGIGDIVTFTPTAETGYTSRIQIWRRHDDYPATPDNLVTTLNGPTYTYTFQLDDLSKKIYATHALISKADPTLIGNDLKEFTVAANVFDTNVRYTYTGELQSWGPGTQSWSLSNGSWINEAGYPTPSLGGTVVLYKSKGPGYLTAGITVDSSSNWITTYPDARVALSISNAGNNKAWTSDSLFVVNSSIVGLGNSSISNVTDAEINGIDGTWNWRDGDAVTIILYGGNV